MDDFIDMAEVRDLLQASEDWILTNVFVWGTVIQLVLLLVLFFASRIIAARLVPMLRPRVERLRGPARIRTALALLLETLQPVLFLLLLWLASGVMLRVAWPSQSYLLRLIATLMTAWIVISLSSRLIRNPVLARTIALFAWTLAALNIVGLLDPTLDALDALAITLGDLRLSVLTVAKGVLALGVLLWAALTLSRLLETRINRRPALVAS